MRKLQIVVSLLFVFNLLNAQNVNDQKDIDKVKAEIRLLLQQLNEARMKHDRPALERIYAKEFIQVHTSGYIDDRNEAINDIMSTDSVRPLPIQSLDGLEIYGDVAILKGINATTAGTVNANRFSTLFIYAKRDGRWQIVHAQGTPLLRERKTVTPDNAVLKSYIGRYQRNAGEYINIEERDGFLLINLAGRGIPKRKLMATSDTQFFDKPGTEYSFSKDEKNTLILTTRLQNGQESKWNKIE